MQLVVAQIGKSGFKYKLGHKLCIKTFLTVSNKDNLNYLIIKTNTFSANRILT